MWLKKIKKKRFQFILVGLMLCFTSTILTACIAYVNETTKFTDNYTSFKNCPNLIIQSNKDFDYDYFADNEKLMEETAAIKFCDMTIMKNAFRFNGKLVKTYVNCAYHLENINTFIHNIKLLEGTGEAPSYGELWITSIAADVYGIKVGDILYTGSSYTEPFRVGGIVATPVCPSAYMGVLPYYICPASAELFHGEKVQCAALYSKHAISCDEYQSLVPQDILVGSSTYTSEDIGYSISYLADIFGGVGLLAAAIIFCVSLIIIRFIIVSTLSKEYKEIGTYKALGFTEKEITGFYLKSYLFSGELGILAGMFLSLPLAEYLCNTVLRHLGKYTLTASSFLPAVLSAVVLTAALILGLLLSLRRLHRITPVEAFSSDSASSKEQTGHSLIKNAYSPLAVSINDIVRKRRTSILMLIVLTVSFYMTILFISLNYSLIRIGTNTGTWFAFPQYDALISLNGTKGTEEYLSSSQYVTRYISSGDISMAGVKTNYDIDINNLNVSLYSDCTEEALGLPLISGRHPVSEDEILMTYNLADELDLEPGEWFHLENDNYSNDYLITGLNSSMFNGGRGIAIDGEEYSKFVLPRLYSNICVFFKDGVTFEEFEADALKNLPGISITETAFFLESSVNSTNSVAGPLTVMFAIIFSVFSILNIINLLIMNNIESRRQYGILKAMGFTNVYICIKNILKIFILTAISSIAAIILHLTCSQKLFFTVIHVNGLIKNIPLTLIISGILFAVIMIVAALFMLPMRKVAPTELMEE